MFDLEQQGYVLNALTGIWERDDYAGIAYSDGDTTEIKLGKILREASDLSALSSELREHCTDWATLYHLSSARGNILRPFEQYLNSDILEIGAGCGAISRYLGECGGNVLSLEGSPRRAQMAASRTRDLDNVTVLAERFDDFKTDHRFDVITLIGVLEYASMFSNAEDPALGMLERIRSLLKPNGHLFIAIENQLGLKYFAGAPEDHLGVPMYGIEGRYLKGQPKTFGRKELAELIKRAGFAQSEFLSPNPDYKLPNSITTERGLGSRDFDAAALAWQNVKKDPQLPGETFFNLEQAWPVVIDNGLGMDMANSFLIAASQDLQPTVPENVLAYHYSTGRKTSYCKESRFVDTADGIVVKYRRLDSQEAAVASRGFNYILPEQDRYVRGHVLSEDFLDIAATQNWTIDDFGGFVTQYIRAIQGLLAQRGESVELNAVDAVLPGIFLDAVPQNIVINDEHTPSLIDIEWEVTSGVSLGHLLMRALLLLIASANPFVASPAMPSRRQFVIGVLKAAGLSVTHRQLDSYVALEAEFQETVTGRAAAEFLDWAPDEPVHQKKPVTRAVMHTKLYCSDAQGTFSEASTTTAEVFPGKQTLSFDLSNFEQPLRTIRFDPVDTRISFSINYMRVISHGETLWAWSGRLDELKGVAGLMQVARPDYSGFFLSMDSDPHFELPIDLSTLSAFTHLTLELELVIHTDEHVAQELKQGSHEEVNSPQKDLHAPLQLLLGINKKLNNLLTDREGRIRELTAELDLRQQHGELFESNRNTKGGGADAHPSRSTVADSIVQNLMGEYSRQMSKRITDLLAAKQQLDEHFRQALVIHGNNAELPDGVQLGQQSVMSLIDIAVPGASEDLAENTLLQISAPACNEQVRQLQAEVAALHQQLQQMQIEKDTHIHNLNLHILALARSTSWRITRPLRVSVRGARMINDGAKLLPSIVRRGGGVGATLRKAARVLRAQGVQGVIAHLNWFRNNTSLDLTSLERKETSDRHDYTTWVEHYDTLDDTTRWKLKEQIRLWPKTPVISIIMPVYNPPIALLEEAVASVQNQLYSKWELCIADDASTNPEVAEYLKSVSKKDARIKVSFREKNGHISEASNSALALATGAFVALMDNDDLIAEHALYWIAKTINENPQAGIIYSDEDKIDNNGVRSAPYFKSSWNKFLFRSQNMICHLGAYRRDLVNQLGGFRVGFEGSQDYDLALRCSDAIDPSAIIHIPRVLYHWRMHSGSTALAGNEKPYAALAGVRALDEHLQRIGCAGHTELLPTGMYRVHYEVPSPAPLVSLVIPTKNAHALVKQCIDSIIGLSTYPSYEIILVDNGSDEPASIEYFESLKNVPNVRVVRDDGPFNYSAINNRAVEIANGELVGLINNDIEVITPEWLDEMVAIAMQPGVGAVGARLWYPDDRLQHGGVVVGVGGVAGHSHKYLPKGHHGYFGRAELIQEFSAVTAACLIIKKSIFNEVHGLDEVNLSVAFNDVDFCLRVQEAGYVNVWTPYAELYHHESATRGLEDTPAKKERFTNEVLYMKGRWPKIEQDYTYNPNLTLEHEDFGLAWPPRVTL